jgi:hypothetical protein
VDKALLALDRGRLELIGFAYPPLPFLLVLPWPTPLFASVLAALAGGLMAWILWRQLRRTSCPIVVRIVLVAAALGVPSSLFLLTQALSETLALLLFLIAWVGFLNFTRAGDCRSGFVAGLALGLAFFVSHYALLYGLAYALFTPMFMRERGRTGAVAAALVLFFPVLITVSSWCYVNWIFSGDALTFTRDPGSSMFVYSTAAIEDLPVGWRAAAEATARNLCSSPLYLVVGVIVLFLQPSRLAPFLVPAVVIAGVRSWGLVYPDHFAIPTLSVAALAALHRRTPASLWPALALAALVQLWAGYATPLSGEPAAWRQSARAGRPAPKDVTEVAVAGYLAQFPRGSVLLDDRLAHRVVSRAGTAAPFLLPADPLYGLAETQPAAFVRYVLVPGPSTECRSGLLSTACTASPRRGLRPVAVWERWSLYERWPDLADTPAARDDTAPPPRKEGKARLGSLPLQPRDAHAVAGRAGDEPFSAPRPDSHQVESRARQASAGVAA